MGRSSSIWLALVPALLVARCGLWPDFPEERLRSDAGVRDGSSADVTDASDVRGDMVAVSDGGDGGADAAQEVGPDAPSSWNGFRICGEPLPMGPFAIEPAFSTGGGDGGRDGGGVVFPNIVQPRDLSFDGNGRLLLAARENVMNNGLVAAIRPDGTFSLLYTTVGGFVSGIRTFADSRLAITGSFPMNVMGMSQIVPGLTVTTMAGADPQRVTFSSGFSFASAVHNSGVVIVADSTASQLFQVSGTPLPSVVMTAVDQSAATGTALDGPRALAFSADYSKLYVASQNNNVIFEFDMMPDGTVVGASRRRYASGGFTSPRSLAFDECGNLYITAVFSGVGGAAVNGIVRVAARSATGMGIVTVPETDTQRSIAFGEGPGFDSEMLYFADATSTLVRRVNVGIRGHMTHAP
ncbi:MAG: hypothetical protein Q8Q09_04820 [Deltaproteobacteria bacterium]|nr:hypothetical protein [Deltaproteobacteria bacterium]